MMLVQWYMIVSNLLQILKLGACMADKFGISSLLIQELDACAMVQERHTCLHAACKAGHVEVVKHLCGQYGTLLKKKTWVGICVVNLW
jgi:hypothetical protein